MGNNFSSCNRSPRKTSRLFFFVTLSGCDFFDFEPRAACQYRSRLLSSITPSTALTLGNGPLLSATLSYLSSRLERTPDFLPRCAGNNRVCGFP
jgi:hypothetical protein